ncbi:MAG TPA: transglutaminase domain-containing protein, partial [Phenylobacterium sp.]|nr:transglutaminase domain-containing protein [Phenylobacterium sp.]
IVVFSRSAHEFVCEAAIHLSTGLTAQAKGHATEIYAAFESCREKMDKQLRRYKRRIRNHHSNRSGPVEFGGASSYILAATEDAEGALLRWLHSHAPGVGEPALDYVLRLNRTIHQGFDYQARYEEGVQSPDQTLTLGRGTCRDFAWLMVESLRRLGFAARFVSGYLHSPGLEDVRGAGATHAWCEVFLPAFGWMEFDPTNGLAEAAALIPVAVSRTPAEAAPISGTLSGDPGASQMTVSVDVRLAPPIAAAA